MTKYFNKDCFDILPTIPDKSVDLIFCDLPYKQTNCKWDSDVDIDKLWIEFKRIRKDTTPIIFTCTTKFGYELITANPKEFKFDMVWFKSRKCGFLQARRRPLTNHEMVYFFYKKQPKYNYLKYHKYTKKESKKEEARPVAIYGDGIKPNNCGKYIPTLPASVIEEDKHILTGVRNNNDCYGVIKDKKDHGKQYDPALPASVIENGDIRYHKGGGECCYGKKNDKINDNKKIGGLSYTPALPASVIEGGSEIYTNVKYEPALPASIQPFKSTKPSKHQTGKPVDLMEFLLKYWTDENDIVFDPTFGGGSMPIACKKLNRKFIGCELDKKFYDEFMINIEKY